GEEYPANPSRVWTITKDTFRQYYDKGKIVFPGDYDFLNISRPVFRVFESEDREKNLQRFGAEEARRAVSTLLPEEVGRTEDGTKEITDLFGRKVFPFAKPSSLIKYLLKMIPDNDFIVLDFFAGSATTAHAVLELNKEDGGNRRFIMVQLPEPCEESSEAHDAGYKTIAELAKERIRLVIRGIEAKQTAERAEAAEALPGLGAEVYDLGLGFKVLKLDKSNFRIWDGSDPDISEEKLIEQLDLHVDHVDPNATEEDILYELLLKAGFMLTERIEEKVMAGKRVYSVSDGDLLICLEDEVTEDLIQALAAARPKQVICLDRAFSGNDQLKANAVHTFAAKDRARDGIEPIVLKTV
ncbi:MAG TPA: DNA methyltransferase, partial [Limnochordia bacterium]|nr:DNA methyltransferase [Limnochordia bacterium]